MAPNGLLDGELRAASELPSVFKCGRYVVLQRNAELPAKCVLTGEPAEHWHYSTLGWSPRSSYLLLLLGPHGALHGTQYHQRYALRVPLSHAGFCRRRNRIAAGNLFMFAGVIAIFGALMLGGKDSLSIAIFMAAGAAFIAAGVLVVRAATYPVRAARMDNRYIWLKGICPAVADSLPELVSVE